LRVSAKLDEQIATLCLSFELVHCAVFCKR
jgi:hypothetical protein